MKVSHAVPILFFLYICRASARPPTFPSTMPYIPSSLDGIRNRKALNGSHSSECGNRTPPSKSNSALFVMQQSLSQSEAFPPLSARCSNVDNKCDVTLHIKASAYACLWHFVLGLGSEHLLGS